MKQYHNWQRLILTFLILALVIYIIYKFIPVNDKLEHFESEEKISPKTKTNEYLKLGETFLDDSDKNLKLDILYANYSGEEVDQKSWKNKTLTQCMDTCNKLDGCVGFSREVVADEEMATCYPRTSIDKCHTYRKGSFPQRQHALAYNTYIKSTVPESLTKCLGDSKMTLGRKVFLKSHAYPDKFIGLNTTGEIGLVARNESGIDFKSAAQFTIIAGMDGTGTVSIKHDSTGKYLFRDKGDVIIGKTDITTTEEKQRASFNLEDGMSNNIVIKCFPLQMENTARYVSVNPKNNKFLNVRSIGDSDSEIDFENGKMTKKQLKNSKMITFEITDTVINMAVIDNRKYIKDIVETIPTYPTTPNSQISTVDAVAPKIRKYSNENIIQSFADVASPAKTLDNSMDDYNYYRLMGGQITKKDLQNYVQDTYLNNQQGNSLSMMENDLVAKLNTQKANANLGDAMQKAQERYAILRSMNSKLEGMLNNENNGVIGVGDGLQNNLDKMKIQDLSKDYFFLKNLAS